MKWREHRGLRFLVAGLAQNMVSYGAYLALLLVVNYAAAYLLSFAVGVLLAFVLNSLYVFRVPLRWMRLVPYPLVYIAQAGIGLALTWVLVEFAGVHAAIAPALVLAVTVPATYLGNRFILGTRPHAPARHR